MSKQVINVGSSADDGTGDKNRIAFQKCNANFTELYNAIPTAKQYKFLLSQSGGDDPQTATSGTLTQGVTYEIVSFETGDDFTINGAPNNDVGTKWISNGIAPTWSNGSEIGWNGGAPVLINNLGISLVNSWFEYYVAGAYFYKKIGAFLETETLILSPTNGYDELATSGGGGGGYTIARLNDDTIIISVGGGTDGLLLNTPFSFETK